MATQRRQFLGFEEARRFARTLGLRSQMQWQAYAKGQMPEVGSRPDNIPSNPYDTYRGCGWVSWPDWLGKK